MPSRGRRVIRCTGATTKSGAGLNVNRRIRVASTTTASWIENAAPIQTRGPTPNGR